MAPTEVPAAYRAIVSERFSCVCLVLALLLTSAGLLGFISPAKRLASISVRCRTLPLVEIAFRSINPIDLAFPVVDSARLRIDPLATWFVYTNSGF
jgi:hypothetical protein